jgi:hypothetical protein
MKKPDIDTDAFARELEDAVGKPTIDELRRLPLEGKETLRFFSEHLHMKSNSVQRAANTLLSILRRDRLQFELQATTDALREAEMQGNEKEIERLSEQSRTLASVISQMSG